MAAAVNKLTSKTERNSEMSDNKPLLTDKENRTKEPSSKQREPDSHETFANRANQDIQCDKALFSHPSLLELEEKVKKSTKFIDDLHDKLPEEKRVKRQELSQHIPGPLRGSSQAMEEVMKHLEDLIVYENYNDADSDRSRLIPSSLRELDSQCQVAILAHSLGAYIATLSDEHLRHLSTRIISDSTLWMARLFRFKDSSAYFAADRREGLSRVTRMVLHRNFPKYATEGFEALYSKPPVIYVSAAAAAGLGQFLCTQLGLPFSCLSSVPCNTVFGSRHKMDIAALEKLVQDDLAAGRTPLLLVAYAGTPLIGEVDNLTRLQEICKKNKIWLHLEGHHLATLSWFSVPTAVQPAASGDSMTLDLGTWLGLPAIPYTTLYRTTEPTQAHAAGLTSFNPHYKLSCLPLWICLQTIGHDVVVKRIQHCIDMSELLIAKVRGIKTLRLVTGQIPDKQGDQAKAVSLRDAISNVINAIVIFDITNPTLVFRYVTDHQADRRIPSMTENEHGDSCSQVNDFSYYNALNIWLAETLQREVPEVAISAVEVENEGMCIRFAALETVQVRGTQKEHMDKFIACLQTQLEILNATVKERETLQAYVDGQENLRLIAMPDWAGLGAIQYIPDLWVEKLDSLSVSGKKEISEVNVELVHKLKTNDNAFALGKSSDDMACVRFGLITPATDVEELVAMVFATGKEIEESSKYLEKMSDIIKKGIEEASQDLIKENEDKLYQEGVLRQVPVVGSLYNWFSPPPKDTIKGRTFNLTSGKVASTESTYKYHMQIHEEGRAALPDKSRTTVNSMNGSAQKVNGTLPQNGHTSETEAPEEVQ